MYGGLGKEAGGQTDARCLRARKGVRDAGALLHHIAQLACSGTTDGMDGEFLQAQRTGEALLISPAQHCRFLILNTQ